MCYTITARGTIGHVEFRNEKFYPIIRLIVLIPKIEVANPLYLKYILSRIGIKNTGSVIPQLTIPKISDVKVQLPLLKIQEKIVKEVEEIEQKIERAKQFLINAKEMKQEVLNKHLK